MSRLTAPTRTALLTVALLALLAPAALAAAIEAPGTRIQHDVLSTIDAYQALLDTPAVSPGIIDGIADARAQIASLPPSSFASLDPALLRRFDRLHELAGQVSALIAMKQGESRSQRSDGFPVADYPVISFDFVIHPAIGIPSEGSNSGFELGLCTPSMAPNAQLKFTLLNASKLGGAIRDTARRFCDQTVIILGEGANLAPVCIISDILYLIIRGIQDNMFLCSSAITGAEITGSYQRLEHLHGDVVAAESLLTSRIDATQATLVGAVDANEARIRDITLDLAQHDRNLQDRVRGIMAGLDGLADELAAFRAEELRIRIECALADAEAKGIGDFLLPEALGGHIELVDAIVADTIVTVTGAGGDVGNAEELLADAEQLALRGEFAKAYARYGQAYRAAAR